MTAKSILVAVPTLDQYVNTFLAEWLLRLAAKNADPTHPHKYQFLFVPGMFPVDFARNRIANEFLASTATHLFFVDADQVPLVGCEQMFDLDIDIVSGATYILQHKDKRPVLMGNAFKHLNADRGEFLPGIPDPPAEIFEADAVGTGCVMIARRVFEDPRMVLATTDDIKVKQSFFAFTAWPTGEGKVGEDIGFTWRAKQLGYQVVLDGRSRFDHAKTIGLGTLLTYAEDRCALLSSTSKQPASQLPMDDSSAPASSSKTSEPSEPSEPEPFETSGQH